MAQFAWSGNWQMHFEQQPGTANTRLDQTAMLVSLGSQNDFSGALTLPRNPSVFSLRSPLRPRAERSMTGPINFTLPAAVRAPQGRHERPVARAI